MAKGFSDGQPSSRCASTGMKPELLDVVAVGRLLNCSARHVLRMADRGKLPPAVKFGKLTRWPRRAIESWIADGCRPCRKGGAR